MRNASRKLNLNRETLVSLQVGELAEVNGGTSPAISVAARAGLVASARFCPAIGAFTVNQAQHGFTIVPGVINTAKKVGGFVKRLF